MIRAHAVAAVITTTLVTALLVACSPTEGSTECVTSVRLVNERAGIDTLLTEATAQSQLGGRVIALFVTDYPQEGLTALGRQPELTEHGNLVWIDIGDPRGESDPLALEPGDVVDFGAAEPLVTASHWTATRFDGMFANAAGSVTVRDIDDVVCVDVQLQSDEISVAGTINAPLIVAP